MLPKFFEHDARRLETSSPDRDFLVTAVMLGILNLAQSVENVSSWGESSWMGTQKPIWSSFQHVSETAYGGTRDEQ